MKYKQYSKTFQISLSDIYNVCNCKVKLKEQICHGFIRLSNFKVELIVNRFVRRISLRQKGLSLNTNRQLGNKF